MIGFKNLQMMYFLLHPGVHMRVEEKDDAKKSKKTPELGESDVKGPKREHHSLSTRNQGERS